MQEDVPTDTVVVAGVQERPSEFLAVLPLLRLEEEGSSQGLLRDGP
jgi:hypothetical protein